MLAFLNVFFFVFHTVFMLFNMFGWIWKRARRWHLYGLALTYGSWFVLGIWYGMGYCACTDFHWQVRRQMGIVDHSESYTHFLILKITGLNLNQVLVDYITLGIMLAATVISIVLNSRDYRRKKRKTNAIA
jgi:hypothetical protein